MDRIGKTKIRKTIFWCEELLVGDIQGMPRGIKSEDTDTQVITPDGVSHKCEITEENGGYSIKYTPRGVGVHTASVKRGGAHVDGSPFRFAIEPFDDGHEKVKASGSGLISGLVGRPGEFSVSTVEAGAGALSVATEGPRQTRIEFRDEDVGICGVTYMCSTPGDYKVSVKFNDKHIPNSPFIARVA